MASETSHQHSPKSLENQELRRNVEDRKTNEDMKFRLGIERLFRRELHKSFDLNRSVIPENDASEIFHLPLKHQNDVINKFGKRCHEGDSRKNSLKKMALRDELSLTNEGLDLELRLSTKPNHKYYYSSPQENQSNSSTTTISSEKPASCPPLDLNSKRDDELNSTVVCEAGDRGIPSLVLMGCANCYLYVMVSESEPQCPKCHTSILIDRFRGSTRA